MRARLNLISLALLLVACTGEQTTQQTAAADESAASEAPLRDTTGANATPPSGQPLARRTGELVNPDAATMVFLYYDLAGIAPPIDSWVEADSRMGVTQPADKASMRSAIKAELEAAAVAVRGIGFIRLSMHADLSEYDPTYGEFTVRALAPSSVVSFDALGQKIALNFANGRTAQIWRVAPAEARQARDKIAYVSNVSLDALLKVSAVRPGPGGGTITTEVLEYELHEPQRGITLARVQLAQK